MDPYLQLLLVAGLVVLLVSSAAAAVAAILVRREARRRIQAARTTAMGAAVGRILHQLQNPLQGLLLQSDRLRAAGSEVRPEAVRDTAAAILAESERVSAFLGELRLYASGATRTPDRRPMDLAELAASVVRRRGAGAGAAAPRGGDATGGAGGARDESLRVPVQFGGLDPLPVSGDAYLLDQCLENLVKNAQQAVAESGRGTGVRVLAERRGRLAVVVVEDDGPGLPGDAAVRVFEPFHTTRSRGMGLGLPICREIAESHGGALNAGPAPGGGARFTLGLPLREG